jgi:hypothetical protein
VPRSFDHAADRFAPGGPPLGLFFQFVDLGADGVTQSALDALFDFVVTGLAVRIDLERPVIDGGAEGDATAAAMAQTRFLHFLNQIEKCFHGAS